MPDPGVEGRKRVRRLSSWQPAELRVPQASASRGSPVAKGPDEAVKEGMRELPGAPSDPQQTTTAAS